MRLKTLLLFAFFAILIVPSVQAAQGLWVDDPADCPQDYVGHGQSCPGSLEVCGIDGSDIAQCYDTDTLTAPASNTSSNTDWNTSFNGGYLVDCYQYDGSEPHCDNSAGFWCDRNSTCYTSWHRNTICTPSTWGDSTCGTCRSAYTYCDGSFQDDDGCEIQTGVTNCPAGDHNNINASCDCTCDSGYLDCDASGAGSGNGCEVQDGGSCSVGGLSGTYDGCDCIVDPMHHITGARANYSTSSSNLWSYNADETGTEFNVSNPFFQVTITNGTYRVNGVVSIWSNGTVEGAGTGSGVVDTFVNTTGDNMTSLDVNVTYWIGNTTDWWGKILTDILRAGTGIFESLKVVNAFFVYNNGTINMDANLSVGSGQIVLWSNGTVEIGAQSDTTCAGNGTCSDIIYQANITESCPAGQKLMGLYLNGSVNCADDINTESNYTGVADDWVNETGDSMSGDLNISASASISGNLTVGSTVVIWSNGTVEVVSGSSYGGVVDDWVNITGDTMTGELNVSGKIYLYPNGSINVAGNVSVPTGVVIWSNGTVEAVDSDTIYNGVADSWINTTGDTMTGELNISGAIFLYPNGSINTAGNISVSGITVIWSNGTVESPASADTTCAGNGTCSDIIYQSNITETCPAGQKLMGLYLNGSVNCADDINTESNYSGVVDTFVNTTGDNMTALDVNVTYWIGNTTDWWGKILTDILRAGTGIFESLKVVNAFFVYNNGTINVDANYSVASGERVIWSNGTVETGSISSYGGVADDWVNETGDYITGELNLSGKIYLYPNGSINFDGNMSVPGGIVIWSNGTIETGSSGGYSGVADAWVNETGDYMRGTLNISNTLWLYANGSINMGGNFTVFGGQHVIWSNGTVESVATADSTCEGNGTCADIIYSDGITAECVAGNVAYGLYGNGTVKCRADINTESNYTGATDSYWNTTGETGLTGNYTFDSGNTAFWSNGTIDTTDLSCDNCIDSDNIADVDDIDVEGDLNTYVDIAGDVMVGDLNISDGTNFVNISAGGNINATGVISGNHTYLGNPDDPADACIYFATSGTYSIRSICYDAGSFLYQVNGAGIRAPNIATISNGDIYSTGTGNVFSGEDIYTDGSTGDLWLGAATQSLSKWVAYADGSLNISNGAFVVNGSGGVNLDLYQSCTALETDASGNLLCGTDDTSSGGGTNIFQWDATNVFGSNSTIANLIFNWSIGPVWANTLNVSGGKLYVNDTGGVNLTLYQSCNLETDASGNVVCGTDDTGAGTGQHIFESTATDIIAGNTSESHKTLNWSNGDVFGRLINITGDKLRIGNGTSTDLCIEFSDSPTIDETFCWQPGSSQFYMSDDLDILETLTASALTSESWIKANSDIYTTGSGDDLWLGKSTQASSSFNAYANGSLYINGPFSTDSSAYSTSIRDTIGPFILKDTVPVESMPYNLTLDSITTKEDIGFIPMRSGSLTGLSVSAETVIFNVTIPATCDFEVYKNGVATGLKVIFAEGSRQAKSTTQAPGLDTFDANDVLYVIANSTGVNANYCVTITDSLAFIEVWYS